MRGRSRLPKPERLEEILQTFLKKKKIPHTARDRRLIDLWNRAVGPRIADRTYPETLQRGTLLVRVASPVWLHQLQFMKEEILERLQELSGNDAIRTLRLCVGELPQPSAARPAAAADPSPTPLKGRDQRMVEESLAGLKDPELRAILERVMVREIGRRRELERAERKRR